MNRLISPSTDFRAVRDGRNSQVFYVDVALGSARSAAAGTGLVLPISGNSFYIDANPTDGNAFVHFQDTNFDRGPVPLYVSPGTIFNIPYTQILLENTAQPGKKIRIAYGIDVDFQPGSVSQIAVTNAGGYTSIRPEVVSGSFFDTAVVIANTPTLIFAAGSNPNGAILEAGQLYIYGGAVLVNGVFIAKATAPASISDGTVILASGIHAISSTGNAAVCRGDVFTPQSIPSGLGLYFIADGAAVAAQNIKMARYKFL